jgi:hypothetical protein
MCQGRGGDSKGKALNPTKCRCLMPLILTTQEAEIRRIVVQNQPRQIVQETLSGNKPTPKKGLVEWLKV